MANRPLSPHLQVYRPQLTSVSSILHRITGAGLALGCVLAPVWLWAALSGDDSFASLHAIKDSLIGQIALFGWLFSFVYHLLNGIRHLAWDMLLGLDLKTATITGWLTIVLSIAFTLFIWNAA